MHLGYLRDSGRLLPQKIHEGQANTECCCDSCLKTNRGDGVKTVMRQYLAIIRDIDVLRDNAQYFFGTCIISQLTIASIRDHN